MSSPEPGELIEHGLSLPIPSSLVLLANLLAEVGMARVATRATLRKNRGYPCDLEGKG